MLTYIYFLSPLIKVFFGIQCFGVCFIHYLIIDTCVLENNYLLNAMNLKFKFYHSSTLNLRLDVISG